MESYVYGFAPSIEKPRRKGGVLQGNAISTSGVLMHKLKMMLSQEQRRGTNE